MEQLKKLVGSLSLRQRIAIAVVALLVGGGIWSFARWRQESDFRPLYRSMSAEDAGAVVQKLKEKNVPFRLSDSGAAVLVPSAKVAEARLELAAAGLPKTGRIGFELFDKTTFGATEFVEHINYQRALEGELERSVMSLAEVEQARVHVTFAKDSVYLESKQPAKASVIIRLRSGSRISATNVLAICHLVASAVEGLDPAAVSVLDMNGNLLSRPRRSSPEAGEQPEEMLEIQQKIERDLVAKIHSTLEPLLGPDRFQVSASVEVDLTSGEQSEETFDPEKTVLLTSQKSEETSGGNSASGAPGTASNLPRPASRPAVAATGMGRRTENLTYQPSRLVRRTRLAQGGLKRMSLSVLLDQEVRWEGQGAQMRRVLVPPSPQTLKTLRDLIAGATGFNQARGDQLILESLPFESTLTRARPVPPAPAAPAAPSGWPQDLLRDRRVVLLAGIAAAAVLVLLAGIAGLVLRRKRRSLVEMTVPPALKSPQEPSAEAGRQHAGASLEAALAQQQQQLEGDASKQLKMPELSSSRGEALNKHMKDTVKKDPALAAQVLRIWLEEQPR